ncbi:MAG: hypothetical protein ACTHMX_14060 [Thermomicrobiales bacterium]
MRSRLALLPTPAVVVVVIVVVLALGLPGAGLASAQGDIPRPPQFGPTPTEAADGDEEASSPSCAGLPDYYRDLNRAFMGADALNAFLDDGANYEDLTAKEAQPIVDDAGALVDTIKDLDVPEVYADGNEGIATLIGYIRDQVAFYGLDSTKVPRITVVDDAYQLLYDGETSAAEACPREIADFGGYIFIDPATIEDDVDTGK